MVHGQQLLLSGTPMAGTKILSLNCEKIKEKLIQIREKMPDFWYFFIEMINHCNIRHNMNNRQ